MSALRKNSRESNRFEYCEDIIIGYTKKGEKFYFDKEDFDLVSKFNWHMNREGYIVAEENRHQIALHRLVMKAGANELIDHINHQKENACKSNLRSVSQRDNSANGQIAKNNTSGVTGVNFNKRRSKWIARLMRDGISHFLGAFESFEEAVAARKAAEEKYFGDYSYDNSMAASPVIEVA